MQKWRTRLESKEEFDCSVLDPDVERRWSEMPEPESKNKYEVKILVYLCFGYDTL